ncbi:MAG TPA: metallophosphoesterase [Gemmataceae bacterium]|nr:metallophosphoesterase [Gemmataceae bacterium]
MPDPTRLLATLQRAIDAFRATPGRRGRVVHLEGAVDVLAAGDLHGNVENFRRLLHKADLARNPGRHLVLQEVVHGPFRYPAGGDRSHQLLDLIAALKCQHPRQVHFLIGNHELSQSTGRSIAKDEVELNDLFIQGVRTAYGERADEVYADYLRLIAAAPVAVRTPNRVFLSHSLPPMSRLADFDAAVLERDESTEADCRPGGAIHALLWGRDIRPETAAAFLQKVDADLLISGHIPNDHGFEAPNDRQLILDSLAQPAACCLLPADRPLTHAQLMQCVSLL